MPFSGKSPHPRCPWEHIQWEPPAHPIPLRGPGCVYSKWCDAAHEEIATDCFACHAPWRGASAARCVACHKVPDNALHRKLSGGCTQCHSQNAWNPATFDHDKSFLLDADHNVTCITCHITNDYRQYTCYGCHAHTVENVLRKHREEGIRNLDNCVRCHKSAKGEGEGGD